MSIQTVSACSLCIGDLRGISDTFNADFDAQNAESIPRTQAVAQPSATCKAVREAGLHSEGVQDDYGWNHLPPPDASETACGT